MWRGAEVIGAGTGVERPVCGDLLLARERDDPVGAVGGHRARLRRIIPHRIDDRATARFRIVRDMLQAPGGTIEEGANPRRDDARFVGRPRVSDACGRPRGPRDQRDHGRAGSARAALMRVVQPRGRRGSLKWMQRLANDPRAPADALVSDAIGRPVRLTFLSPLESDDFAEYRDARLLDLIGRGDLEPARRAFWPRRGPQWDAAARDADGAIWLIEAKAHIDEMLSPASAASADSRARIKSALADAAAALGAAPRAPWIDCFYQLANRLAWIAFLRECGVDAKLLLVNVLGDAEMGGPTTREAWEAAYRVAFHVMGLPGRHALSPHVVEIFPDCRTLSS